MDLSLLATLKETLVHATNLSDVWTYFYDHFGEDPQFIALGQRARHPFLETVLGEVGRQLFGKTVPVDNLLLTELPEHQFVHGGCTLGGRLANVMYFEDIRMGMLAVVVSFTSSETKMVRFTGRPMPVPPTPSQN